MGFDGHSKVAGSFEEMEAAQANETTQVIPEVKTEETKAEEAPEKDATLAKPTSTAVDTEQPKN